MATIEAVLRAAPAETAVHQSAREGVWITAALAGGAIAIHGYHPYAEDGGVYLAGVKRILDPQLYPYWTGFVTTHLRFSLFAPMVAALVRATHFGIDAVVFALYAVTTWITLYAAWLLASRCAVSRTGRVGAVTVLTLALTIPVAGTSLMLMDPYVTARSFSTPFGILMLVSALDAMAAWEERRPAMRSNIALCGVWFVAAAAVHPLMAVYALSCTILLVTVSLGRRGWASIAATSGVYVAAPVLAACAERMSPLKPSGYDQVALTRTYWFPGSWQWYELVGLVGPLVVLAFLWGREKGNGPRRALARAAIASGVLAFSVAALFAQPTSATLEVAKLQPLRMYETIYILMLIAIGMELAERVLRQTAWRWAALCVLVGGAMACTQRLTFPHSPHIEAPWRASGNPWQQAFEWIRTNTPEDAVFALDGHYINAPDEDSQNFRAIAERSVVPDSEKDGGIAAIAPDLTSEWLAGQTAQTGLNRGVGPAEIARLRAYAVDWVVVTRNTPVEFPCTYANDAVKVCKLP